MGDDNSDSTNMNGGSLRGDVPPEKLEDFAILKVHLCSLAHAFLIKFSENLPNIYFRSIIRMMHIWMCVYNPQVRGKKIAIS